MTIAKICDRCQAIETEKKYHDQMKYTLPIYEASKAFIYDREKDLCSGCRETLAKIIASFFGEK